jgi:hypothetical protein
MRYIPKRPTKPLKVCPRCKLQTPEEQSDCIHCTGLSETQLQSLIEEHQNQLEGNAKLGRVFLLAAAVLFALLFLGALNR